MEILYKEKEDNETKQKNDEVRTSDIRLGDLIVLQNGNIYLATKYCLLQPIKNILYYDDYDYKGRPIWDEAPDYAKPILKIVHKDDEKYELLFKKYLNGERVKTKEALVVYL